VRLPARTVSTQVPRREDELELIKMDKDQPRLYRALSRGPFPKSYVGKVFFTAFLGTQVPLLALLVYVVYAD
jgi:hypothetical protein